MPTNPRSLESRLSSHPELHKKIEQLLMVVESTGDDLVRADEAERQVIETLRQMGSDALSAWANQRINHPSNQSHDDEVLRARGQKNATGLPPTESSK